MEAVMAYFTTFTQKYRRNFRWARLAVSPNTSDLQV